ncbi:MAG: glycosyl transferase [Clostridia bacterium]|nr:glycosyl transferase [Clostridia bacterium]
MPIKKIHYCWFGGNPLSDIIKKCIASWKKECPDYEIIEWNESNFDIHCCKYVEEAYNNKKWAFVSDYARFQILYENGGIYVDTDVELIRSISDLPHTFVGFESDKLVASGLIRGADIGDLICQKMMESYQADRFVLDDGTFNTRTVCARETELLREYGLKLNGTLQTVAGTTVFPTEYFCPKDFFTGALNITDNTYSIHHYDSSWYDEEDKYTFRLRKKIQKFLPTRLSGMIARIIAIKKFRGMKAVFQETTKRLKK